MLCKELIINPENFFGVVPISCKFQHEIVYFSNPNGLVCHFVIEVKCIQVFHIGNVYSLNSFTFPSSYKQMSSVHCIPLLLLLMTHFLVLLGACLSRTSWSDLL